MKFPNKNNMDVDSFLDGYLFQLEKAYKFIDRNELTKITDKISQVIKEEKIIYTCGNGGSAAIAEHFIADFNKGASIGTKISPKFYSLSSNIPTLTAISNDIGYEEIFSFQLSGYGNEGDALISVSSSGNSPNIVSAIKKASSMGISTISFVGFDGGEAKNISDYCIHIPIHNYGVVEDAHHTLMHIISQFIRMKNLKNPNSLKETTF
jgi:D-sedoheptulose 7-phosphate isomerase